MPRKSLAGRLLASGGRALRRQAADAAASGASSARRNIRDISNGGRFTCGCGGKSCPGSFRSLRAHKAHAAKVTSTRWVSAKARAAGRKMGKPADEMRRHVLGWLEASGLREWKTVPVRDKDGKPVERNGRVITREIPVLTDRARTRPQVGARPPRQQLAQLHRHDRHHERADRHDQKADRHEARGKPEAASQRRARAAALRGRWTEQPREPQTARPAPDDAALRDLLGRAAAHADGTRPAPSRTARTGRSTRS